GLLAATAVAVARAQLDTTLPNAAAQASLALRRQITSYDLRRARAPFDRTQRLPGLPRRGSESRFRVGPAGSTGRARCVPAPSLWADDVYASSLQAPAAVGLSAGAQGSNVGIYANQLLDYVGNVDRFVQGYSVARPTSVAQNDTEVLTFGGPQVISIPIIGG